MRRLRGPLDVRPRRTRRAAIGDVVGDAVVEEHDVLAHQRDLSAQARQRHRSVIDAVDQDQSLGLIIETRQQARQRGLAAAGRPHQRDALAGAMFRLRSCITGPFSS
jgi:hypothetical protein